MLIIDLKSLGTKVRPATQYLTTRLDDKIRIRGSQVQLDSTRARTAKLLLHKFLRHEGLENYRVVMVHHGLVQVLKPEVRKKRVRQKEPNYGVPCTIPQYQVAAGMGGLVPTPRRRKWKP